MFGLFPPGFGDGVVFWDDAKIQLLQECQKNENWHNKLERSFTFYKLLMLSKGPFRTWVSYGLVALQCDGVFRTQFGVLWSKKWGTFCQGHGPKILASRIGTPPHPHIKKKL